MIVLSLSSIGSHEDVQREGYSLVFILLSSLFDTSSLATPQSAITCYYYVVHARVV